MNRKIDILVSVNSHLNGCPTGYISSLLIEPDILHLDFFGQRDGFTFSMSDEHFNIGKLRAIKYENLTVNCGNWCWNKMSISVLDCTILLNYLLKYKNWEVSEGVTSLFRKCEKREKILMEDLIKEMGNQ